MRQGNVGTRDEILERISSLISRREEGRRISDVGWFISSVISIYDDVYFGGQIQRMAERYGMNSSATDAPASSGTFPDITIINAPIAGKLEETLAYKRSDFGVCDIITIYDLSGDPKSIKLEFYPFAFVSGPGKYAFEKVISKLQKENVFDLKNKQYTLYTIMYIVEHVLIHLLMILWKYHEKGLIVPHTSTDRRSRGVYTTHGLLFKCLLREYFGYLDEKGGNSSAADEKGIHEIAFIKYYRLGKSDENPATAQNYAKMGHSGNLKINPDKLGLIKWSNNSCFFDSIMMAIFFGASSHIRDMISKRGAVASDYLSLSAGTHSTSQKFKNPFPGKKATASVEAITEFASTFREYFKTSFEKLLDGNIFIACSMRSILGSVDRQVNTGEQYEPYMVYGILCNIFPKLKMTKIPTERTRKGKTVRYEYFPEGESTIAFPMDDFVTLSSVDSRSSSHSPSGVVPIFDDIYKEEHLAFFIQHPPWLKRWNELGDEIVQSPLASHPEHPEHSPREKKVTKIRAFDEYILSGRYRLYAVVLHAGNTPMSLNEPSYGHYTLLLRPFFDKEGWYYYDDVAPSMGKVSNSGVPTNAFWDTNKRRPHMLLYERV